MHCSLLQYSAKTIKQLTCLMELQPPTRDVMGGWRTMQNVLPQDNTNLVETSMDHNWEQD
jgi:hypothetical protein